MPLVFPFAAVKEEFAAKSRDLIKKLIAPDGAATKMINSKNRLVVRTLRPKDLGIDSDTWSFSLSAGSNTIVDHELDDKTMIVILGVFDNTAIPLISEPKFGSNAGYVEDVELEQMFAFTEPVLIFDRPIMVSPGSVIKIEAIAKDAGTEELGFIGFVIEPEGKNIYA